MQSETKVILSFLMESKAQRMSKKMSSQDVVSWTTMIGGYGHSKEAFQHFKWMCKEGVQLNYITFLCFFLACSYVSLMNEN